MVHFTEVRFVSWTGKMENIDESTFNQGIKVRLRCKKIYDTFRTSPDFITADGREYAGSLLMSVTKQLYYSIPKQVLSKALEQRKNAGSISQRDLEIFFMNVICAYLHKIACTHKFSRLSRFNEISILCAEANNKVCYQWVSGDTFFYRSKDNKLLELTATVTGDHEEAIQFARFYLD